jgi:hypothetical protein
LILADARWKKLAAMPKEKQEEKNRRAKKELAALNGTAKLERGEMRAADEARATGQT